MADPSPPFAFEGVSKAYGGTGVLDRVSLTIEGGTFFGILGPSGSGKTTLLMIAAGFARPDAGTVRLGGRDITGVAPEKRNFGMVFQGYALFPTMTVGGNVGFPLAVRGVGRAEREARVRATLDLVHLGGFEDRHPRQLSGGQQQRVALARALIFEPEVLLLDEPLSALDKKLRIGLQAELCEVQRRVGKTFICVTHDQEEALSMSDRIAILRNGAIAQEGPPQALFERPASHFVADFLGESNFLDGFVEGVDGGGRMRVRVRDLGLVQRGAAPLGASVLLALRPSKITVSTEPPADAANRLRGTVTGWNYRGTAVHAQVSTSLGPLGVVAPTWGARFAPARGQAVWLSWPDDAAVVVTDDRR